MPSKVPEGEARGWIVPIGGAENKENDPPHPRALRERFGRRRRRHRRDPHRQPHARDRPALREACSASSAPRASP